MESLNPRWASASPKSHDLPSQRSVQRAALAERAPPLSPAFETLNSQEMVGERFPKQKVLPGTVQEAPQDCAEGVPRNLYRRPPLCTDFDTRDLQKMGAERFRRHESLTKHQETPRRSKKSISQRTCRIREKGLRTPRHSSSGWLSFFLYLVPSRTHTS